MTITQIPADYADMVAPMRQAHRRIRAALAECGLAVEDYPLPAPANTKGQAASRAYPIQGILKYHGIADWEWRTAYLPSISVNNDAAYSLTLVAFDPDLDEDRVWIGGQRAAGREHSRVQRTLDVLRTFARIETRARVVSRNVVRATRTGKGLGTSASASAALAAAAIVALYGGDAIANQRFLSCMSRLLAGSGCRSAVGGVSLWLSYPGIAHEDGYAVRLDDADQLADMRLITVPLDSRVGLKTEMAHHEAPQSPFYRPWMLGRCEETLECLRAVRQGDWRTIGQLAELDSIRLHGVTMSASRENKLFAWEPENIHLFRMCNDLRAKGVPVYFSTDTGPTIVMLTHRDHAERVVAQIMGLGMGFEAITGRVAGPATLVDLDQAREELGVGP